ncbi:hypothetical protein K501DRAFT_335858 [Backusella circina FSU 941]|nr:hypothetical protein K501DRAFT_335858 [Backusella circina FSU 941]
MLTSTNISVTTAVSLCLRHNNVFYVQKTSPVLTHVTQALQFKKIAQSAENCNKSIQFLYEEEQNKKEIMFLKKELAKREESDKVLTKENAALKEEKKRLEEKQVTMELCIKKQHDFRVLMDDEINEFVTSVRDLTSKVNEAKSELQSALEKLKLEQEKSARLSEQVRALSGVQEKFDQLLAWKEEEERRKVSISNHRIDLCEWCFGLVEAGFDDNAEAKLTAAVVAADAAMEELIEEEDKKKAAKERKKKSGRRSKKPKPS